MQLRYEWDENKRNLNIQKHGLDFILASTVFSDKNKIERMDARKEYKEKRYQTIGLITVQNTELIILVVWTHREDKIRIISARRARKNEKEIYYER